MALVADSVIKPDPWCPGYNLKSWDLWRGCVLYLPMWARLGDSVIDLVNKNHGSMSTMDASSDWLRSTYGVNLENFADAQNVTIPSGADKPYCLTGSTMTVFAFGRGDFSNYGNTAFILDNSENSGGANNDNGYRLLFAAANDVFRWRMFTGGGAVNCDTPSLSFSSGAWHRIVGTYDGTNMRIYYQGLLSNTAAQSGSITTENYDFRIGAHGGDASYWPGSIALIALWDRCLLDSEIAQLSSDPFCMIRPVDFSPFYAPYYVTQRNWGFVDTYKP